MTQHQLGQKEEARATLILLREIMKEPHWPSDGEAEAFLREATELIEVGAGQLKP
jgi:hypothetical protein